MLSPAYSQCATRFRWWRQTCGVVWTLYGGLQLTVALFISDGYSLGGLVNGNMEAELARFLQGLLGACVLGSGVLLLAGVRAAAYLGFIFSCCMVLLSFLAGFTLLNQAHKEASGLVWLKVMIPAFVASFGAVAVGHLYDDRRFRRQQFADVGLAEAHGPGSGRFGFSCPHCGKPLAGGTMCAADLVICPHCLKGFTGGVVTLAGVGAGDGQAAFPGRVQCVCEQVTRTKSSRWGSAEPIISDQVLVRRWNLPLRPEEGSLVRTNCPYCAHDLEIEFFDGQSAGRTAKGPVVPACIRKDIGTAGTRKRPALVNTARGLHFKEDIFFVRHKIASPEETPSAPVATPTGEPGIVPPPEVLHYKCPQCGTLLNTPVSNSGKVVKCPKCTTKVRVSVP